MLNRNILNPMLYQNNIQPIGLGIYHNPTAGLISLSSDGTNRITIADKNLGATQVYNDGDELTQANCGNYYQWGNNYGFPFSGSITTSSTRVNATNYGPYYESDTFIIVPGPLVGDWSSVRNNNLWGGVTGTQEAMQGPAPDGYHIPSQNEYTTLVDILSTLGIDTDNGICIKTYLKMPFSGYRTYYSATTYVQGALGLYWSANGTNGGGTYYMEATSSKLSLDGGYRRAVGASLRCFKNTPIEPNNSWTTLYQGTGNAGIYHNPSLGVISLSADGTNWITIADKNIGATKVYNDGDVLSEENCGKYYQWGNNYGFPWTGEIETSTTQVDATNYGPYYKRGIFVTGDNGWRTQPNQNLWGGVTNTKKAMQGPCNPGFHVGSRLEYLEMFSIVETLGAQTGDVIKMPLGGHINDSGQIDGKGERAYINVSDYSPTNSGASIRPFKNEPVTPNSNRIKLF